ncbi:hypothetical protein N0B31_05565 [Salinirubellus salinus]|uniref:Uncharacterized protein n=1 Tax=Salinirubellus salinus TaxID=1364945 RepID=A0A9E7R527_9EURY|nr:hypothetical protein [Salinirubellus salinus]UWM55752.1 hypothetical protein N0B31_05565 [Salinirubellus salinus]
MTVSPTRAYLSTAPVAPERVSTLARASGLGPVVAVLTRSRPADWVSSWPAADDPMVVDLSGNSGSSLRLPCDEPSVVAGLARTDLTGVSMVLTSLLEAHGPAVFYFESLTGLCRDAGRARTTRFVRETVHRVCRAGGTVVADVDPSGHRERELRDLSAPFDRVVGGPPAIGTAEP